MPKINIDGKVHEVTGEKNLLETILSLGYDLPYFCWHPALGSVGSCRQCAVRKYAGEDDTNGRIVMSCMEPVMDNLRLSIDEQEVSDFRKNVIEWLMVNHPHDCPICDEGGECHLQDMTVMTGHSCRKYNYKKRTYHNQDLGPCINHEMNRCIQCYRCVRFYNDYAGGDDLQVFAAHDHVYFGRHEDGTLESEFSGNLVEVCPTGVFTDKTLKKHYTRKWDLTNGPSICHHCSLGCNIIAGERYGTLRRIRSRFNEDVNGYFICDRGRFGYDFVNGKERILKSWMKSNGEWIHLDLIELRDHALGVLKNKKIMGLGSPRASLESNFALRTLVGAENFYCGISGKDNMLMQLALDFLQNGPLKTPSLKDIEQCDAVIVIGEDVTNTAPMMDLALKQAVIQTPLEEAEAAGIPAWNDAAARGFIQDKKSPLYILTPQKTKLDTIATHCIHDTTEQIARLTSAIGHQLDNELAPPNNNGTIDDALVNEIAAALINAKNPLIITGTSLGSAAIMKSAINLARALHKKNRNAGIAFVFPECNSAGLSLMEKKSLQEAAMSDSGSEVLIILENDLFRRQESSFITGFLSKFNTIAVLDHTQNDTTSMADLIVPAGTFAEADGTLVNNEGRAQRFFQVQAADVGIFQSWRWICDFGRDISHDLLKDWYILDDLISALESEFDVFNGISKAAPGAAYRIVGQKIARSPHRYSGRTAMFAQHKVSEPKPPIDRDSPLSFTMEGHMGSSPSSVTPFYWSPGWNSGQSINKFRIEIDGSESLSEPGVRLIEPSSNGQGKYITDVWSGIDRKGKWKLVPLHHIFGSEELSVLSEAISERCPGKFLTISKEDATELGISHGDNFTVRTGEQEITLPANIDSNWANGQIGFPAGFRDIPYIENDAFVELITNGKK